MPVVIPLIAAGVGAAGSIYAANQAGKANDKAIAAGDASTAQNLAFQKDALAQATTNNAPFLQAGQGALAQLSQQFGLGNYTPSYGAPANQNAASQYDIPAYVSQNPDVAAKVQELTNSGVIGPNGQWKTGEDWVSQVQLPNAKANGEQRNYPASTPTDPNAPPAPGVGANFGPTLPDRPEQAPRQTFDRPSQGAAPALPELTAERYQSSPGYANRLKEAGRTTNANFAAKGLLASGAAATEFGKRQQDIANEDFGDWENQQLALYDRSNSNYWNGLSNANQNFNSDRANANQTYESDRQYGTGVYDADRNYLTSRFDQNVSNLFNLTGIGQSAANNQSSAQSNYAANAGNVVQNNANNLGSAYANQANIAGGLAGNLAGAGQNLLSNYAGGTGSTAYKNNYQNYGGNVFGYGS